MKKFKLKLLVLIRQSIYLSFWFIDVVMNRKNYLFILCYHGISSDNWRYSVDFDTLKKQVGYLLEKNNPVTLEDVELYISGKKKLTDPSFALCFDDGYRDVLQAKEYFKMLKIFPAIFILSDRKDANREELDTNRKFLNKEEILELKKEGWIIGSHGATHSDFWKLTDEQLEKEVVRSKKDLEEELGIEIKYFAYPKGRYTDRILSLVEKAGYSLGFSMDDGFIKKDINLLRIPRVGVDRTHSFAEFRTLFSPLNIKFRSLIKFLNYGK